MKPEEVTGVMNDFNEPGSLAPTGLYLGGTKYMVIQGESGAVIRGKKVAESNCYPNSCLCILTQFMLMHFDPVHAYAF